MSFIFYPSDIDYSKFSPNATQREAYYGLPDEVKFCGKCVISNQRPNSAVEFRHTKNSQKQTIHFDGENVCDACRFAEKKTVSIDWNEREHALQEICNRHRSKDGSYDCLVPGSGGKDSFYAAHKLKYKYGMHPLTVTWAPHLYTTWGWHNFQAWVNAGFDNYLCTPNPRVHRLLTRLAVDNLFHPFQPFMLGQKFLAPKLAVRFHIPLVFYGENEAEYGNPIADAQSSQRDWKYFATNDRKQVYLGGTHMDSLIRDFDLEYGDLSIYLPEDPQVIQDQKIEIHYLGYYIPWHPQECFYYVVENGGFRPSPERTPGTYSKYNSIDDKIDDFHYYTTYIKFGIGRATYDAAQEIRNNEIDRNEGVSLVKKFDGEYPARFEEEIFRYLSIPQTEYPAASKMFEQPIMDREYFLRLADRFRSPHLWMRADDAWKLRFTVFER
ncbi:MAG: N-acetyl sugar amidotransferase [Desulfovibrio sp.]|nr:N-acetyl sugar amidotransferase [Desulfovibrio sp.]